MVTFANGTNQSYSLVQIHWIVFKYKYKYYKFSKSKYNFKYFGQDSILSIVFKYKFSTLIFLICKLSSEVIPLAYILVDFKGKVTAYDESKGIYT